MFAELNTGADGLDDPADRSSQAGFSEGFDIGYEILGDSQKAADDSLPPDTYELYGDNQWPREDLLPGFRETYLRYYAKALELSRDLMMIFALALDLEETFFDDKMGYPGAMSRMMHYPPKPVNGEIMPGIAAHTVSPSPFLMA
jgi:isopenicillin N synthase-like dioxygenase